MKSLAKSVIKRVASALPWGVREATLDGLCGAGGRYGMLMRLAAELNAVAFGVRGRYGTLQGSARDKVILRAYAETGVWAERTVDLIRNCFKESDGGVYVDVGANIGATVIPIAANPKVNCLALEPEPATFQHLITNIGANCAHGNVQAKQVAAFSRRGTMSFEISPTNMGDNRLRTREAAGAFGEEQWHSIDVETVPLDEIVPRSERPLVVKIDTQGAEPHVVEGGKETISRADLIILEYWPYGMARMGADQNLLLEFLANHFEYMSIAHGETAPIPFPLPIGQACEVLSALANDPKVYVDIITGRNVRHAVGMG
jgi:FkbM family methyltransferase